MDVIVVSGGGCCGGSNSENACSVAMTTPEINTAASRRSASFNFSDRTLSDPNRLAKYVRIWTAILLTLLLLPINCAIYRSHWQCVEYFISDNKNLLCEDFVQFPWDFRCRFLARGTTPNKQTTFLVSLHHTLSLKILKTQHSIALRDSNFLKSNLGIFSGVIGESYRSHTV